MNENELTKKQINSRRSICVITTALIICLCSFLQIKADPLPFVLQNMIVVLAAAVFGGVQPSGAVGLFLIAGILGLPVFAGGASGPAHVQTVRGTFLLGYFISALVVGLTIKEPVTDEKTPMQKIITSCVAGYAVIYVLPLLKMLDGGIQVFAEVVPKLKPYFLADLIKCLITIPLVSILRPIAARKLQYEK